MEYNHFIIWKIGEGVFISGLFAACVMDWMEQKVYRFLWLWAGLGAALMLLCRTYFGEITTETLAELCVFVILQQVWFSKFYGRADCHAYCVCAINMYARGLVFRDCVMHMFFAFLILGVVQIFRKNVGKKGNLKKPVAFVPYIAIAFLLWVDFKCGKCYI